jgi:hypothetical protein
MGSAAPKRVPIEAAQTTLRWTKCFSVGVKWPKGNNKYSYAKGINVFCKEMLGRDVPLSRVLTSPYANRLTYCRAICRAVTAPSDQRIGKNPPGAEP